MSEDQKPVVLYIDDETENLSSFQGLFFRNYRIFTADSALKGLELLRNHEPDVILCDQRMPGRTGVSFFEEAAASYPQISRILVTGYSDIDAVIQAINLGKVFHYIAKPWDVNHLKVILDNAIETTRLRKEREILLNDLKISNLELEKSRQRYEKLSDLTFEGILLVRKSTIVDANHSCERIFGMPREKYVGKLLFDFFGDEEARNKLRFTDPRAENPCEINFLCPDGKLVPLEVEWKDATYDNEMFHVLAFRNITLRKQAEIDLVAAKNKAEESDRLKTSFLANMSHEIRTPMNGIIGFADLLRNTFSQCDEVMLSYIDVIWRSSNQLLKIVNDILDISKIQAGMLSIIAKPQSINKILDDLYLLYSKDERLTEKEIKIVLHKTLEGHRAQILVDEVRLSQILSNLIDNAIKFTQEGTIEFGYDFDQNAGLLRFFVFDTGIGIKADKHDLIFERFRQADENLTRQYGGTGLGLAIARGIVDLLKGNIWFESAEGQGSRFYFSLPYEPVPTALPVEETPVAPVRYDWAGKTILIVEDDHVSFSYLREVFKSTNVQLLHADTGDKALDLLGEPPLPNLILMDIRLPDISGLEITRRLRENGFELPIIAQTANAMHEDRQKSLEAGCSYFMSKPLNMKDLLSVIDRLINK